MIGTQFNRATIPVERFLELRQVPSDGDADWSLKHVEVSQVFFEQVHQRWLLHLGVVPEESKNLALVELFKISLRQDRLVCLTSCHSEQFYFPNVDLEVLFEFLTWI